MWIIYLLRFSAFLCAFLFMFVKFILYRSIIYGALLVHISVHLFYQNDVDKLKSEIIRLGNYRNFFGQIFYNIFQIGNK